MIVYAVENAPNESFKAKCAAFLTNKIVEYAADKLAPIRKVRDRVDIVIGGAPKTSSDNWRRGCQAYTLGDGFDENMKIVEMYKTATSQPVSMVDFFTIAADALMTSKAKSRALTVLANQSFPLTIRPIVDKLATVKCDLSLGSSRRVQLAGCPEIRPIEAFVAEGVRRKLAKPAVLKFPLFLSNRDQAASMEVCVTRHAKMFRTKIIKNDPVEGRRECERANGIELEEVKNEWVFVKDKTKKDKTDSDSSDSDSDADSDSDSGSDDDDEDNDTATQAANIEIDDVSKMFRFHKADNIIDLVEWRELYKFNRGIYVIGRCSMANLGHQVYVDGETKVISGAKLSSLVMCLKQRNECLIAGYKFNVSLVPRLMALKPRGNHLIGYFIQNEMSWSTPPTTAKEVQNDKVDNLMDQYIDRLDLNNPKLSDYKHELDIGYDYEIEVARAMLLKTRIETEKLEQRPGLINEKLVDELVKAAEEEKTLKRAPLTPIQSMQTQKKIKIDSVSTTSQVNAVVKAVQPIQATTTDKGNHDDSIADSGCGSSLAPTTQQSLLSSTAPTKLNAISSDEWSDDDGFDQLASQMLNTK